MILGIFGGTTTRSIERRVAKLARTKEQLSNDVSSAIADRTAALNELREEITILAKHQEGLK